jgi:mannose-6-phosphate isomerase
LVPKEVILHLQKNFPLDVGVLAPIFLNTFKLAPGQALFVSPNVLHAYVDGDAVENII